MAICVLPEFARVVRVTSMVAKNEKSPTFSDDFILQASRSYNLRVKRKSKHAGHCQGQGLSGLTHCMIDRQYQRQTSHVKYRFGWQ